MSGKTGAIWVTTESEPVERVEIVQGSRDSEDVGGGFGASAVQQVRKSLTQRVQVSADSMKQQMNALVAVVGDVFDQARTESGLRLDVVELSVEISSEGQLSILGSGGKLGGKGGIKLTFRRADASATG
ncbi:MAG: hypothetical protein JOZ42_05235 [Acetobacteraceae bacterium]|nr:hypothetical protein [Acetobacteraceae bacterium]